MIGEKERYHGVALARLIQDSEGAVLLTSWNTVSRCAYVMNEATVLFLKYSTNRLSPWPFVFSAEQKDELSDLSGMFEAVWLVMVCGNEGIIAVPWNAANARLLPNSHAGAFSLQASRKPGQKFRVGGSGLKPLFVSESSFPDALYVR